MTSTPLTIRSLTKRYANRIILDSLSLEVRPGEAIALMGPNGAGKTTLLSCVAGTTIADQGAIEIGGYSLRQDPLGARRAMRYLPQEVEFPDGMTGHEVLDFYGSVFDDPGSLDELKRVADLDDSLDLLTTTYSVGMRRRLMFAGLAPGQASLFVLDEPFAGADRESRARFCNFLISRMKQGAGILLAAHEQDAPELKRIGAIEWDIRTQSARS